MATPPLTDDACIEAVQAVREFGSQSAAARGLGIPRPTLINRLRRAAERGLDGSVPTALPPGQVIKGVSTLYGEDGSVRAQWVKTSVERNGVDLVEAVREAFAEYRGASSLIPPPKDTDADLLSVYPIVDVHHGLLSWAPETGENYDLKIGTERLRSSVASLVSQSPPSRQALLINVGDYFHFNDATGVTPASKNALDIDGRFSKVVTTGVLLFRDVIELAMQKHDTVLVCNLAGNHDPDASIILSVALSAFYENNPRVTIIENPSEIFFHLFGLNLIGACHGHRMKPDRMAMAMATMRPEEWGRAKFRWFVFGHIHHETVKEIGGVRCESFQTLVAKDAFHANSGYTAGQSISSVTLHAERGEIGRHKINVLR